MVQSVKRHQVA